MRIEEFWVLGLQAGAGFVCCAWTLGIGYRPQAAVSSSSRSILLAHLLSLADSFPLSIHSLSLSCFPSESLLIDSALQSYNNYNYNPLASSDYFGEFGHRHCRLSAESVTDDILCVIRRRLSSSTSRFEVQSSTLQVQNPTASLVAFLNSR